MPDFTTTDSNVVINRAVAAKPALSEGSDPITTQIIRHGLNSAADQMKRTLIRTAYSPVIYEVLDFAVAIYDTEYRLLSQAPSLPMFMGTMSFCVEAAVDEVGGQNNLVEGDVILYNIPYGTGSHQPDTAIVVPVYVDGELVAFTAIKGHFLDIAAKDPYCSDTTDVFQEGTVYPGVKIYRAGELNDDLYKLVLANSRLPKALAGDLNAEIVGCKAGERAVQRLIGRYGMETFQRSVERMYEQGDAVVRNFFEKIPDGIYIAHGQLDDNGVTPDPVPFKITVTVKGSDVALDFTDVPAQQAGPINCPQPSTVSAARIAISMLAGAGEPPNEGHFRPIEVLTVPGTLFHPVSPAPTFLYGWPALQSIDVIYRAIAEAVTGSVPAGSGGCICSLVWWGQWEGTGETWIEGAPHPVGQGAHVHGDGGTMLHVAEAATRFTPVEIWEARNPWLVEKVELATDSAGAGEHQGGQGVDFHFRMLQDASVTTVADRTTTPPWGLEGGGEARANSVSLVHPDGTEEPLPGKKTAIKLPAGTTFRLHTGGGGGYGNPGDRDAAAVQRDLRDGYITEEFCRQHYPHAVGVPAPA